MYLGEGILNFINSFMPEVIVIGGGVCKEGDYLLNPLREYVKNNTYNREGVKATQIKVAEMGNDAGIVGAAMICKMQ